MRWGEWGKINCVLEIQDYRETRQRRLLPKGLWSTVAAEVNPKTVPIMMGCLAKKHRQELQDCKQVGKRDVWLCLPSRIVTIRSASDTWFTSPESWSRSPRTKKMHHRIPLQQPWFEVLWIYNCICTSIHFRLTNGENKFLYISRITET